MLVDSITTRLERARVALGRATLVPLLIRLGIALSFVLAMTVAWPQAVVASRVMTLLFVVAVYPAVAPRGRGTTAAVLVVVAGSCPGTWSWSIDPARRSSTVPATRMATPQRRAAMISLRVLTSTPT